MSSLMTEVATASTISEEEVEATQITNNSSPTELVSSSTRGGASHVPSSTVATRRTLFDDIFDDDPEPSAALAQHTDTQDYATSSSMPVPSSDISDVPRLRSIHVTSGYRDGIANGKMQSVQAGFDEGYSLGAVLGLKAGWILGVLEGLIAAVVVGRRYGRRVKVENGKGAERTYYVAGGLIQENNHGAEIGGMVRETDESQLTPTNDGLGTQRDKYDLSQLHALQIEARRSLSATELFGNEFFGEDGIWRFDVPCASSANGDDNAGGFEEVAAAHPRIKAWTEIVLQWMERVGNDAGSTGQAYE